MEPSFISACRYADQQQLLLFTVAVSLPRITGQSMLLIGTRSRSVKRAAVLMLQTTQQKNRRASRDPYEDHTLAVSYTHLDVYKRQDHAGEIKKILEELRNRGMEQYL